MLYYFIFFVIFTYAAYRILKHSAPQLRVTAQLNRLVADASPVHLGGWQPAYDFNSSMTNEMRAREVNQLERVFESGYKVSNSGEWRG